MPTDLSRLSGTVSSRRSVRKIEMGEFSESGASGDIISKRSALNGTKSSQIHSPTFMLNLGYPLATILVPHHPAKSRRVIHSQPLICGVLASRRQPQVATSIVSLVSVDVIGLFSVRTRQDFVVHKDLPSSWSVYRFLTTTDGISVADMPTKSKNRRSIVSIDNGKFTAIKGHEDGSIVTRDSRTSGVLTAPRAETMRIVRLGASRAEKARSARLTDILEGHGDLQSLCRAPGLTHSGAGVSLVEFYQKPHTYAVSWSN